jgi:hypothetical protein
MQNIANVRGDTMSRFYNALYAGDVHGPIEVLRDVSICELLKLSLSCSFGYGLCAGYFGLPYCKDE